MEKIVEKTPAGIIALSILVLLSLLALLVGYNVINNKPFYFMDKKIGFDTPQTDKLEELEKLASKLEEQKKLLSILENQKSELESNNKNLVATIHNQRKEIDKLKKPKNKYHREKNVYFEEKFADSISGVKFSFLHISRSGDSPWTTRVELHIPESGTFERDIEEKDHWSFFHKGKNYSFLISQINPEEQFASIIIQEI